MNRIKIINALIKKNNYKSYLEIGVQAGDCFREIKCAKKVGVDPDPASAATVHMTSDEYFEKNKSKFDIIFIDGLHHSDQVMKDIENSLKSLTKGGIIVMHDCLPGSKRMQEIPLQEQNEWTGDVWRAYLNYRSNPDLEMAVVNCDWGCGIIRKGYQTPILLNQVPSYEQFQLSKKHWMNIISVDEFTGIYL